MKMRRKEREMEWGELALNLRLPLLLLKDPTSSPSLGCWRQEKSLSEEARKSAPMFDLRIKSPKWKGDLAPLSNNGSCYV